MIDDLINVKRSHLESLEALSLAGLELFVVIAAWIEGIDGGEGVDAELDSYASSFVAATESSPEVDDMISRAMEGTG